MSSSASPPPAGGPTRRRLPARWQGAVLGLIVAIVAAGILLSGRTSDDIERNAAFSGADVETSQGAQVIPQGHPADDGFRWPIFGGNPQRTHALSVKTQLRPPFRTVWARRSNIQIEFPPVICGRSLYLLRNDAVLIKLSRRTGVGVWKRKLGALAASSPACSDSKIYVSVLERGKGIKAGKVVAVDAEYGRTVWTKNLRGRTESSPLLWRDRLYLGTEDGSVIALRTRDGAQRWRTPTEGAVKGAVAMSGGKLFVGDYSGRIYALRRTDGAIRWVKRPVAGGLSLRAGSFYSSPSVAFGRLYIGSTDGAVYSLSTSTGKTAWRRKTGDYVYSSPAVGSPGGHPSVFVGSYDKKIYALDARTGAVRWSRGTGGRISGSPTLVGDTVWIASLGRRSTFAYRATDGLERWRTNRGAYTAVVSDGRRIYLNGLTTLYGIDGTGVRFERGESPVPSSTDPVESKKPAWQRHAEARDARGGSGTPTTPEPSTAPGTPATPTTEPEPEPLPTVVRPSDGRDPAPFFSDQDPRDR
ncbi:MAG: PQQ-binding-like beta-propeller repeat protein [Solirubrobacteraceae bacterium]|nr:PQQ-binding-like beta-propeller repeat protein [Solirubrobacteraceae bacterium]